MFTIEAWIKYDLAYKATDAQLMTIFGKFISTDPNDPTDRTMKVGFAVANKFMRIYVNDKYYDFDYPFIENANW